MPAAASSSRCGAWFDVECSSWRRRLSSAATAVTGSVSGAVSADVPQGSGGEELWKRGLWGAGTSELWMERLVDEVRVGGWV